MHSIGLSVRMRTNGAACRLVRRGAAAATLLAMLWVGSASAEAYLPIIGGNGGGQFVGRCPAGQLLAGFELRVGDDVDAIRPLCVTPIQPGEVSAAKAVNQGWYGGSGGGVQQLLCPSRTPVVIGVDVAAEGVTMVVNNIHLFCGQVVAAQMADAYPSAILDAPNYNGTRGFLGKFSGATSGSQRCPGDQIAVGVHGRYGVWLDAMGLICDVPVLPKPPVALGKVKKPIALGRVKTSHKEAMIDPVSSILPVQAGHPDRAIDAVRNVPTVPSTRVDPPICASARQARARNSPATASLEAQCRAAGGTP